MKRTKFAGSPKARRSSARAWRRLARACLSSRSPHNRADGCSRDQPIGGESARQATSALSFLPGGVRSRPSAVLISRPPSRRKWNKASPCMPIAESACQREQPEE